MAASGLAQGTS